GTFLAKQRSACQAENTVKSTVPRAQVEISGCR
ncbi:MAG: hypothetical protein QOJ56_3802, partial [Mycobacterium sp.]|nr:hypothetical protein [Mycobacterium sp.]